MLLSHVPAHFKSRRDALIQSHPGAVFIFPSNSEVLRNPDVPYGFRQESNFFYLTGFEEPESFLVLTAGSGSVPSKMVLFVRRRDATREMWEGERYGVDGARNVFQADDAFVTEEFDKKLPELLQGAERIYYRVGLNEAIDRRVIAQVDVHRASAGRSGRSLLPISDPNEALAEMRLFKRSEEVAALRKASQVSALAHKMAMTEVRPGMNEFEIEALIDYSFRRHGCQRVGYGSIVAGGKNATCLHYRLNNQPLKDNELLLIDAGGEFDYYCSDITRTFPVGRSFTAAQAKTYDLVLRSQKEAIAMAKPGTTLAAIHQHVCEVITDGLLSLGLLKGNREEILKSNGYSRFYPHRTSHYLGMDVHDVGLYITKSGEPRTLEPGMVFTIEPGFYAQPSDPDVPEEYREIGIRIEDDILITPGGCEVLTADAPKERAEIEGLKH